jgi:hypothetical protein
VRWYPATICTSAECVYSSPATAASSAKPIAAALEKSQIAYRMRKISDGGTRLWFCSFRIFFLYVITVLVGNAKVVHGTRISSVRARLERPIVQGASLSTPLPRS